MSSDTRIYAARPILVSGTCKREHAPLHAELIKTVISACKSRLEAMGGRLLLVASDGESRRGAAFASLARKDTLDPSSPVGRMLSSCRFLNTLVGPETLLEDKDYRHNFKQGRNGAMRASGVVVAGVHLTSSIIRYHFRSVGVSEHRIRYLLNPEDKQDVLMAISLLKELWSLPPPSSINTPGFAMSRNALRLLGRAYEHLVLPYTCVSMTLSEQLQHLSAAVHLLLSLYTHNHAGTKFIPIQLYTDIMVTVKTVYFCVASIKSDDPNAKVYIILFGTDRLETAFGVIRTMVGNDSNADILQLCSRLSNVTEVATILAKCPQWDESPWRLRLSAMTASGDVDQKVDHINPPSWTGDICVKTVIPLTCWKLGRQMAEDDGKIADFDVGQCLCKLDADPNVDMLAPFGEALYKSILPNADDQDDAEDNETLSTYGEESDEENEVEILPPADTHPGPQNPENNNAEMDLEDHAGAETSKDATLNLEDGLKVLQLFAFVFAKSNICEISMLLFAPDIGEQFLAQIEALQDKVLQAST